MARYLYLACSVVTAESREVWIGLDLPDEFDASVYEDLVPVESLTPAEVDARVSAWTHLRGNVALQLATIGLQPLPVA